MKVSVAWKVGGDSVVIDTSESIKRSLLAIITSDGPVHVTATITVLSTLLFNTMLQVMVTLVPVYNGPGGTVTFTVGCGTAIEEKTQFKYKNSKNIWLFPS